MAKKHKAPNAETSAAAGPRVKIYKKKKDLKKFDKAVGKVIPVTKPVQQKPIVPGSNWAQLQKVLTNESEGKPFRKRKKKEAEPDTQATASGAPSVVDNTHPSNLSKCLAIDCEMVGVGSQGRESVLARVTVVNAQGNCVYDTHVAVTQKVTDYRTHVSGIRPYHLKGAPSFDQVQQKVASLLKGRILVGHTLKSDMAALMLIHPKREIRDLTLYPPCCHGGLPALGVSTASQAAPKRGGPKGLKVLAAEILGLEIQQGEHSSLEDARATMLIYQRFRKQWERDLAMESKRGKFSKSQN